jgi:TetR/AcrR family transcriptional regulator, cholesterol catabolism regulator
LNPARDPGTEPRELQGRPLGRRERKKLETRRRIFRAAFELFARRGFDGTTVEEIAERADVAKGTVFNYFPQKRAFLLAAHQEWMTQLTEDLGPPESWTGTARNQLMIVLDYLADLSIQHKDLSRMVIFESMRETFVRMGRDSEPDSRDGATLLEGLVATVMRGGRERGEIRDGVDGALAANLVATTTFGTLVRWLVKGGSTEDMKAALAAKLDIIFTGLNP